MKSPKQLRTDIRALTHHLTQVRDGLLKRADIRVAEIGKECKRTADALSEILKTQELPEDYKVAVVGRFKTGKSSFVNELLGARLASEDTNPETAAITTFRHGDQVKAVVRFLPKEEWKKLQTLYAEDPKHVDAHRVKLWKAFAKPKPVKDGQASEVFDLALLEREFIRPNGHSVEIVLDDDGTKKSIAAFRKKLKDFTSGSRPHHCLVQTIEITSPAAILEEGVLLIDTPGLDDTERFRVSLTEKTVEDVDAVLFLTKSGEAYGQSEKEFLLTLLRKGTVKQLIVVITQVDQTYAQHVRNADANDEEPESIAQRIERERHRIADEIAATLNDLSQEDTPAMRRYREQLGSVEIAFTSAVLHRDWKEDKPLTCAIDPADPGGVVRLTRQLLRLLSTESRLALTAQNIAGGARSTLLDLQGVLHSKLISINQVKDKEVAERKLHAFRDEFGKASQRFEGSVEHAVKLLGERLDVQRKQHEALIENIGLLAEKQIADFETEDVGRHWRTRRSGYWGYMRDFQGRVANRIFPKVQQLLGDYTRFFSEFIKEFEIYLGTLSSEGARISDSLELGATLPFDVTAKLKDSLERSLQRAQELIAAEELRVTALLDDFVTDEVSERISERRAKVSDIWGSGTTIFQSKEVRAFYREVKELLQQSLVTHLQVRSTEFGQFLVLEAQGAPRDALNEVQVLLEQAADNIRAAALALVAGEKELAQKTVEGVEAEYQPVLRQAEALAEPAETEAVEPIGLGAGESNTAKPETELSKPSLPASPPETVPEESPEIDDLGWRERTQRDATVVLRRLRLTEGATGWPFEKIFDAALLKGAVQVCLIDPYLSAHHQLRNLNEFLLHVAEQARPKEIEIVTGFPAADVVGHQEHVVEAAGKELFSEYGVTLTLKREPSLHDRFLVLDHGVMFKLGRGLDLYKPATGLAAHRPASRKVRSTEIDVFVLHDHPLLQTATETA